MWIVLFSKVTLFEYNFSTILVLIVTLLAIIRQEKLECKIFKVLLKSFCKLEHSPITSFSLSVSLIKIPFAQPFSQSRGFIIIIDLVNISQFQRATCT